MDIVFEWFKQPLSLELIIVDLIILGIGIYCGKKIKTIKSRIILIAVCVLVCVLAMLTTLTRNWGLQIGIGVIGSAIAILILVGTLIGIGIKKLR
ncbi:hypothetical protein [Cellulosilyticum ruminicola]|uniref:hypothetical protein n=1 Tax=Cellulosilyticum ruminicola TaxID=425254 RepID=UPI0006D263FC|nr:hypothetical protein [Cellulosilyticum ruminicola]